METSLSPAGVTNADSGRPVDNKMYEHLKQGTGVSAEDLALATRDKDAIEFVFDYSKRWCKFVKDLATCLEKRGNLDSDCVRNIGKQFNLFATSGSLTIDMPLKGAVENMNQMFSEYCKSAEVNNAKKFQGLIDALHRQRNHFESMRTAHKQMWKTELKKYLDAELNVCKMRVAYFQRCQAGVRLSEELTAAQGALNELTVNMEATKFAAAVTAASASSANAAPSTGSTVSSATSIASSNSFSSGSTTLVNPATNISATAQQISQQGRLQAKIEKLEKTLSDNDRKQQESMAAYRDSVAAANNQAQSLEKTKVQIVCDFRLITTTNDEVVRNVLTDYMNHYIAYLQSYAAKFTSVAALMGEYKPCSGYLSQLNKRTEHLPELVPERFTFDDYFECVSPKEITNGKFSNVVGSESCLSSNASGRGVTVGPSDSEEEGDASSRNVFSHIVEISSNLFRQGDAKKPSIKKPKSALAELSNAGAEARANTEAELLSAYQVALRCINEIENNPSGLATNGIYRVPASKLRVSTMLEAFSTSRPEEVDLSEEHPLTLASLLKGRLISLAEPLLTWNLYPTFVNIGKDTEGGAVAMPEILKRIKNAISELPLHHKIIAGLLFHHLKRVADHQSENQMGSFNLGTLFGPTLLRQKSKFCTANMTEFVDNKSQSKVVEMMIENVETLFGEATEYYNSTGFQKVLSTSPGTGQSSTLETVAKQQLESIEESTTKNATKEERHPIATRPVNFVPSKTSQFSSSSTTRVHLDTSTSSRMTSSTTSEVEDAMGPLITGHRVNQSTSSTSTSMSSYSSYAARRHASAIVGNRGENGGSSGLRSSIAMRRRGNENQSQVIETLVGSTHFVTRASSSPKSASVSIQRPRALSLQDLTTTSSVSFVPDIQPNHHFFLSHEASTTQPNTPNPVHRPSQAAKDIAPHSRKYSASTNALDQLSLSDLSDEDYDVVANSVEGEETPLSSKLSTADTAPLLGVGSIPQSLSSDYLQAHATTPSKSSSGNNASGIGYFFSDFKRALKSRFRDTERPLTGLLWHKSPQVAHHHRQCPSTTSHTAASKHHQHS